MAGTPNVLLVEDSAPIAALFQSYLTSEPINLTHVSSGEAAMSAIADQPPHLVLLDLKLPDIDGREILRWIREQELPTAVVVITSLNSVDVAVDVMQAGAQDFLEKPVSADRLKTTIHNTLEKHQLQDLVEELKTTFDRDRYHGFIGGSLPMQAVYRIIDSAAPSKASVFITGESGTGKEVCAEAIHQQSKRSDRSFVAINCGAIPHNLMESEIFGHIKGAFTGASTTRQGAASLADGGTLFLDEITEMSLELQIKLLRFVQTGTFQKVGSNAVETVNIRFICATNREPLEAVAAGRLREDLYYRLHVVPVNLPPLRERSDDILEIANHFLVTYAAEENRNFKGFAAAVEVILCRYDWPGNVRQLQNVIRNIVVLHDEEIVTQEHLPPPLDSTLNQKDIAHLIKPSHPDPATDSPIDQTIQSLATTERLAIEAAIEACQGNIPRAAALLEVSPSTLYRKKQSWGN